MTELVALYLKYVALYVRISKDKRGRAEGVAKQEVWGRDYAAHAWPGVPVRVFSDNHISAENGDHRPGFEELREAIARGEVIHLWCVEQSRLERREVEWFRLAAELDAAGISELHTNRDGIVRVRDEIAGIKAVLNAGEVRKMKARQADTLNANAAMGRPAGSRPFGYRHGLKGNGEKTLIIVEAEAAVIRDAAEKILTGWSLTHIAALLRDQGMHGAHRRKIVDKTTGEPVLDADGQPTTRPTTITNGTVRQWFNPTVAGKRVHKGRVVGAGNWPAILDDDMWNAVRTKLSAPRVVATSDGHTYPVAAAGNRTAGRRYLFTGGVAVCGVCQNPLVATVKQLKGKGGKEKPYYLCHPNNGGRGCVGIMAPEFEDHVVKALLDELDKPAFLEALAVDEHAQERDEHVNALQALEGQRNQLAQMWADNELDAAEWQTARRALAENEQRVRMALAAVPPPLTHVNPAAVRVGWEAMNLDERREIVGLFVQAVIVKRAVLGRKGFDIGRVEIVWRA